MQNFVLIQEAVTSAETSKSTYKKKYKCPYCDLKFERAKLTTHIQNEHEDLIPEGYTALRVAFNAINNKTEGHCIICKGVTDWDENKGRYNRLCNNPACKEAYKKLAAQRNQKVYGTDRLQNDPRYAEYVQRKALAGRKIAGKYKFQDGGILDYFGLYEKKFLEFMDIVMNCKSEDFLAPGPSITYMYERKEHLYLPDFYYVPYNLLIEIKDGGSNPNNHPKRIEEEEKNKAKEAAVKEKNQFNYIRVVDNDFTELVSVMAVIKWNIMKYKKDLVIRTVNDKDPLTEDMSGTIGAALPPTSKYSPFVGASSSVSSILNDDKDEEESIDEGYIINRGDIYYNKDKFDSGEINLCFITGHSGSGKSTMAIELQENNPDIECYGLDHIQFVADILSMDELKAYGDLFYSYFTGQGKRFYKTYAQVVEENIPESEFEDVLFPDFIHYAMKYAKSHKDKRYVIEGVWLFGGNPQWFQPAEFKDYAFYIKGTSMLISKIRAAKRDARKDAGPNKSDIRKAFFSTLRKNWKHFVNNEKRIKQFRDYFIKISEISEGVIFEDMGDTVAAAIAPTPVPYESDKNNYYIIQHMKNNVFDYSITKDPVQNTMLSVDPQEKGFYKVFKTDKGKISKKYLTFKIKDSQTAKELYDELATIASIGKKMNAGDKYDAIVEGDYIYSRITGGSRIISPDQLLYDTRFELVKNPNQIIKEMQDNIYKYLKAESMTILEEQVAEIENITNCQSKNNEALEYYNVLKDNITDINDLMAWKNKWSAMPYNYRYRSDDISREYYGSSNLERFNKMYSNLVKDEDPNNTKPENVTQQSTYSSEKISEPVGESSTSSDDTIIDINDWEDKIIRIKNAEAQGLVIMLDPEFKYISQYTEDSISKLKQKWNKYQSLTANKRVLSNQTASSILGVDNETLYTRILNAYLNKMDCDKIPDTHVDSNPEEDKNTIDFHDIIVSTDTNSIDSSEDNSTSSDISQESYSEQLEYMSIKTLNTSNLNERNKLRESLSNMGWNPEIPYNKEALNKFYHAQESFVIKPFKEIDAEKLLNESYVDTNDSESDYLKDKIVPIFIILSKGVALFSKAIQSFTHSEWSHASISFDSSLDRMYSFTGVITKTNKANNNRTSGFVIGSRKMFMYDDPNLKIKVFALFVTPEQRDAMQKAVDWYIKNQNNTKYNFKVIFNMIFNRPTKVISDEDKLNMVCSQFVSTILSLVNFKFKVDKDTSLVKPKDFDTISDDARLYALYTGSVSKYDQRKIDQMCYKILPLLPKDMYSISESTNYIIPKSAIVKCKNNIFEIAEYMLR